MCHRYSAAGYGLLALLTLAAPAGAQEPAMALTLARVVSADSTLQQPATFTLALAADTFTVAADGRVTRGAADQTVFALAVPAGARIERLYYGMVAGDLVVAWESTDAEGGSTSLARFDGATYVPRWMQRLSTMNTAAPLLAGNELYLGGLDFLARLDAASGDFVWQKTMLTPRGTRAFQAFGTVALDGGWVVFTEDVRGRPGRVLRASRTDGALMAGR